MLELDWHVSESSERVNLEWDQHQLSGVHTARVMTMPLSLLNVTLATMHALYYYPDKTKLTPPIISGYLPIMHPAPLPKTTRP